METSGQLDKNSSSGGLLSPTSSCSSTESNHVISTSTEDDDRMLVSEMENTLPSTHIDFLNLIFPPTPEELPQVETCMEAPGLVECISMNSCQPDQESVLEPQFTAYRVVTDEQLAAEITVRTDLCDSPTTDDTGELSDEYDTDKGNNSNNLSSSAKYKRKVQRSLAFPPCVICTGKATGSHYGAITCEACKGFFRRYLQRKEEFKCTKGGKCEIINRNRGNCSGCRLKKCLVLGMSKDKSKLGRYTVTRRTEAIRNMNKFKGKQNAEPAVEVNETFPTETNSAQAPHSTTDYDPESDLIGRNISQNLSNVNTSNGFDDTLVAELVKLMKKIEPWGPDIKTKKDVEERQRLHAERYQEMIKVFGRMGTIPKEEYNKLYKGYGIDVDGRMAAMRDCCKDIEGVVERYCNFAKQVPGFHSLPYKDQSTLLKVSRADFFMITMNEAYSEEHGTFMGQDGMAYHIEEAADKFLSRKLLMQMCDIYVRWQKLEMTEEEKALIGSLSLVFTDRCKLEKPALVEKIQYTVVDRIRKELNTNYTKTVAQKRFTRIIDTITSMRDASDLYYKEYNSICKDDIVSEELPMLSEFFLEEYETADKE